MKHIRLLTLCFILIGLLILPSCGRSGELDAPTGTLVEYETLTFKWDAVTGARIYTVRIEAEGAEPILTDVSKSSYSLDFLVAGEYTISVCAVGQKKSESSPFSTPVSFTRDNENGLCFKLLDGKEYEVTGKTDASGVIEIPSVYRQKPVTSIGENAFFNCADITEVKLPDSIKSIGDFAFSGCSYLEKVDFPSTLTTLGESAFSGCRMLKGEISLPDGLTSVPKGAFAYCSALEGVSLGEGILSVGENAFTDCSDIKRVSLPSTLEKIGGFAFAACADLTEIILPEGLSEIGEFAFSKALSLNAVKIPDGVKTIGKGAFYHATALSSVTLGEALEELGDSAFLDTAVYESSESNEIYIGAWFVGLRDTSATSLAIKDGTVGIANSALYANKYIGAVELPDSVKYIGDSAFAVSDILSVITGSGVKSIGKQAFLYCEKLVYAYLGSYDYSEQIIKDSSLESIGDYAFMNCTKLSRIEIPDTVTDIGAYAFRNTEMYSSALTGAVYADNWIVDFNKTITEDLVVSRGTVGIARYAFMGCTALKSIKIDGSVKRICKGAFYNCTSLETVSFPDTLTIIEDYSFYNCSSLRLTALPPMLQKIGRSAFYMCGTSDIYLDDTDSDRLEIPSGVTYIGDYAFFGCGYRRADSIGGETETAGIDIIAMGSKIEYIGKCAFRDFVSLQSVVIGGADMIGDRAFYGCLSLKKLTVSEKLLSVGDKAFYKCSSLTYVSFPDSLKEIGDYAFFKCENLEKVGTGGGLMIIGDCAFYGNTALSELNLPESLVSIGVMTFRDCEALNSLALGKKIESVGAHAFYSCDSLTLYVDGEVTVTGFDGNWNSDFLPVIFGCEISAEGFVGAVALDRDNIKNLFSDTVLSAPVRQGYAFAGWSGTENSDTAEYAMTDIADFSDGRKLYAVYTAVD